MEELVSLKILKKEKYAFSVVNDFDADLTKAERLVVERRRGNLIVPDELVCDRELKARRVNVFETLQELEKKGLAECVETRYEFRLTKISTGLFGINRIFLPSSNIFPTLVASDSNDYLTPVSITANNAADYKNDFMKYVLAEKRYRKISKTEALRIQGFPESFRLPETRPRWMKLVGNSVAVPVIEKLIREIAGTGVFGGQKSDRHRTKQKQYFEQMSLFETDGNLFC